MDTGAIQSSLFGLGEYIAPNPLTRPKSKHRCRDCIFMKKHNFTNKYVYCSKQQDRKTGNGYKKIKKLDYTCSRFERVPDKIPETKSEPDNLPF